jgi:radical SAM superfamily enzyme YgiQ (UPF0313 family)
MIYNGENMKILFIFSLQDYQIINKPLQNQEQIQFGVSYISSLLKANGFETDLMVLTRETRKQSIMKFIKQYNPKMICFTSVATEYKFISGVAKLIKREFPEIFLLIGGPHASLNPETILIGDFDAVCIGEGEYPTLELAEQLKGKKKSVNINNLWIKKEGKIVKNPTRNFLQDLDSLPFPDRDMWQKWISYPKTRHVIFLGRGCPYQCTYCCNHALAKLASGKYVRFRSVNNVLEELKELITNYPKTKEIYFEVETIGINIKFAIDFCSKLEKLNGTLKNKLFYGVNLRLSPNKDFEPLFQALKKAHFRFINIGIESGSQRIREEILKRQYSNKDLIRTFKLAKEYGLSVSTYNLIGIPEETLSDFRQTIEINRRVLPDWTQLSIFFPYPGTELYKLCKERGLLKVGVDERMERRRAILDLKGFSKKQIQKEFEWFYYNVYKGHRPLLFILARVLFSKINANPFFNRIYRKFSDISLIKRIEVLFDKSQMS